MNKQHLKYSIVSIFFLMVMGFSFVNSSAQTPIQERFTINNNSVTNQLHVDANQTSFFLRAKKTLNFILETQNTADNNASTMDQIYFRLAAIKILDPDLSNLSTNTKDYWISQVLRFQNLDGGFGGWRKDASSLSHTLQAVKILNWLGVSYNKVQIQTYIESLKITLTNGYSSSFYDGDSDVYTTSRAVEALFELGFKPSNDVLVTQGIKNAQNLNFDTTLVPAVEYGGFGKQSNSIKSIFWTSEVTSTRAAVFALKYLNSSVNDKASAISFLKNLQSTNGGFYNVNPSSPNVATTPTVKGPYTASAIETILFLNGTLNNQTKAEENLLSLVNTDGGFGLQQSSVGSSLRGTYYAILGLTKLNSTQLDISKTLNYLVNWTAKDDLGGFGGFPGDSSSLRETFDAVSSLNLMNYNFTTEDKNTISNYVSTYRNADGGYGLLRSYTESTFRAISIYEQLNLPFPNSGQTISFLQSLQQTDGGFAKALAGPKQGISYVISTYRAVKALSLLNAKPLDVTGAISYISSNQQSDGGFGGFVTDLSPDVTSTYRAVSVLTLLSASNMVYDKTAMIKFIKDSQVADGGFKRSPSDVILPKNVSNMIHTYSAVKTLIMMGELPTNTSGVFDFITKARNRDGGFAEHDRFTSDNAYVFTSLTILKELNRVTGLGLSIPLTSLAPSQSLDLQILGSFAPFSITVVDTTSNNTVLVNTTVSEGLVQINLSNFEIKNYAIHVTVADKTKASLDISFTLVMSKTVVVTDSTTISTQSLVTTSTPATSTSNNQSVSPKTSNFSIIAFSFGLLGLGLVFSRKRRNQNN